MDQQTDTSSNLASTGDVMKNPGSALPGDQHQQSISATGNNTGDDTSDTTGANTAGNDQQQA